MSANIFSVHGLIAWLETQDPETEYSYGSMADCLLCRYFSARGVPLALDRPLHLNEWEDNEGQRHALPTNLNAVSRKGPNTYGAALARAKELVTCP